MTKAEIDARIDALICQDIAQIDVSAPPAIEGLTVFSDVARLNGSILLANGAGPHPTVALLHGFPGNERNLDLAHVLRRAGYNVVYFSFRGMWGSEGRFSFANVVEDTSAVVKHLRDHASSLRVDPDQIYLIGHSMGGLRHCTPLLRTTGLRALRALQPQILH